MVSEVVGDMVRDWELVAEHNAEGRNHPFQHFHVSHLWPGHQSSVEWTVDLSALKPNGQANGVIRPLGDILNSMSISEMVIGFRLINTSVPLHGILVDALCCVVSISKFLTFGR